eukprot:scaffold803_cov310-Pinguiococcus_pyrenoidosus.AAC.201
MVVREEAGVDALRVQHQLPFLLEHEEMQLQDDVQDDGQVRDPSDARQGDGAADRQTRGVIEHDGEHDAVPDNAEVRVRQEVAPPAPLDLPQQRVVIKVTADLRGLLGRLLHPLVRLDQQVHLWRAQTENDDGRKDLPPDQEDLAVGLGHDAEAAPAVVEQGVLPEVLASPKAPLQGVGAGLEGVGLATTYEDGPPELLVGRDDLVAWGEETALQARLQRDELDASGGDGQGVEIGRQLLLELLQVQALELVPAILVEGAKAPDQARGQRAIGAPREVGDGGAGGRHAHEADDQGADGLHRRDRHDVAVAHRGHRDKGPVAGAQGLHAGRLQALCPELERATGGLGAHGRHQSVLDEPSAAGRAHGVETEGEEDASRLKSGHAHEVEDLALPLQAAVLQ